MEYLYAQTGKVLQNTSGEQEELPPQTSDVEDADEGFQVSNNFLSHGFTMNVSFYHQNLKVVCIYNSHCSKDANETDDPTISYTGDQPVPETLHPNPKQDPLDSSVGPRNIPGYDRVLGLAEYLVTLKDSSGALTHQQASQIINLWKNLSDYNRKAIAFPPRFQPQLVQGRFKATRKSTTVVPGIESSKRSFLGQNSGPASWPDCNRYMEVVIIKLCQIYPSPVKNNGNTTLCWTLVGNAYKRIRETILNNAYVMQQTSIQLAEINHRTLIQWYVKLITLASLCLTYRTLLFNCNFLIMETMVNNKKFLRKVKIKTDINTLI